MLLLTPFIYTATSAAAVRPRVVLVARASDISVSPVVDCEKGSVVHIFLIRRIDDCTIGLSTLQAMDFFFL